MINSINFKKCVNLILRTSAIKLNNFTTETTVFKSASRNYSESILNKYTIRTHNCGQISNKQLNQTVCLAGWIQFERLRKFFVLRDKYGCVQLIIKDKNLIKQLKDKGISLKDFKLESAVVLRGDVIKRPDGEQNASMSNGDIEIDVKEVELLNKCDNNLEIDFNTIFKTSEDICLKYRYIHLRSSKLQNNLQTRSDYLFKIRKFLIEKLKFTEIETPTLFKNTPGGANEFVVPTRFKNKYYTLTQSPQQFKQLLMIGSTDKYFQIARCYRDELTRSDRQPEFTQLDLELSFTTSEHIQSLIEDLLEDTWLSNLDKIKTPFRRMTYEECMNKYGSDKPDLRLEGLKIIEIDQSEKSKSFAIRIKNGLFLDNVIIEKIKEIVFQKLNHYSKLNELNSYLIRAKNEGELYAEKIRLGVNLDDDSELNKQTELNEFDLNYIEHLKSTKLDLQPNNDCLIVCSGNLVNLKEILGRIRNSIVPLVLNDKQISESNGLNKDKYSFLWVVDFPLFLKDDESGCLESNHHPFTAPIDQHKELIFTDPLSVIGQHYDLVLNGNEIGGGSIRIHDYKLQKYVFENILNSPDLESMNYFLDALNSGCPPHGGIALGVDRLLSIILETQSIRDVIAFPKTTNGKDLMSDSPNELSEKSKLFYKLN